ncbi:prevent-host-death protein [Staphylococcus gallinarum]|nr:prevent-host-death protein [Staphylococcus gallinarum]
MSNSENEEFYELIKQCDDRDESFIINDSKIDKASAIVRKDLNSIQETLYLESTGVIEKVREREKDSSGYTDTDELDWENL